jgi:hypothetical protein
LNNAGRITIKGNKYNNPDLQKKLLESEGVEIREDMTVDIEQYRHILTMEELKKTSLTNEYIEMVHSKGYV